MTFYKQYRFSPKWYFILGTIGLCAFFVYMGFWQLARAAEKQDLQTVFTNRLQLEPISLTQLPQNTDIRYFPVKIKGHYDNAHSILLDNKIHNHQVGYEILTPFMPHDKHAHTVLINRGWVPAGATRDILPVIPEIKGERTVTGYVYLAPGESFTLGHAVESQHGWPRRMQVIDVMYLAHALKREFYPFVVLLSDAEKEGFIRDWKPIAMSADKHRGYAVQWFTFAGVLIIIFLVLNIRKTKR